ncbi:MAG: FKBP-type peptidyl-prolyl cis-trans isomerase [Eubacteriales bacterium]
MKRTIAMASAAVLLLTSLVGCSSSAYDNPEKYVTLPDLSTITISQADIDADMKETIDALLDENRKADYKEVSEAAIKGDQVNIDYEGKPTDSTLKLTDDTLKGMKAEGADLVLGSDTFITAYTDEDGVKTHDGFEDQLIGAKAGDKVEVKVKFPDKYSNDTALQGVEVIFTVTVNSVSRLTVDEDTLIEVDYEFELVEDEPTTDEPTTDETPATDEETESTPSAASADDDATTTGSDDNSTPDLDEGDDDEDTADFSDVFEDDSFEIDYAKDADDSTFNDLFKISDYRDEFLGKNLYYTVTKEVVIPDDAEDDFADFAGKTVKITFTICSATVLPEYNDELIKTATSEAYTTVAAYEEALIKNIKIDLALTAAEEAATYSGYPKDEAEKLYKDYVDQLVSQKLYSAIGKTLDQATSAELKANISDADYAEIYANAASYAMSSVKSRLLIEYLCNKLDVELTDKEYKEKLEESYQNYASDYYTQYYYSYYYGITFASAKDLESYMGKESLELQYKSDKMSEALIEVIRITE